MSFGGKDLKDVSSKRDVDGSSPGDPSTAPAPAKVRAVMTLVRQDDKILAIKIAGQWTLPGALLKDGESLEDCQARGLLETVGAKSGDSVKIYEGPNSVVFVACAGAAEGRYATMPFAWLTERQFLANTLRSALFAKVFEILRRVKVTRSTVVSKLADGRALYAIAYENFARNPEDGRWDWELREPHHVHAMNAEDAKTQFLGNIRADDGKIRIIGVTLAIGWKASDDELVLTG